MFYDLYSPLQTSRHPLEPGLNEINFIVHAVVSLLNASTVEHGQPWTFYRSGLCPAIMKVIEAIDQERTQLEEALGLVPHRLTDLLFAFYKDQGMSHGSLYEQLSTFEPFAKVPGPLDFSSRFISEDLCYGLVPMAWLGQLSGLPMGVYQPGHPSGDRLYRHGLQGNRAPLSSNSQLKYDSSWVPAGAFHRPRRNHLCSERKDDSHAFPING